MKDLLFFIVKSLVDNPEQVQIQEAEGERGAVLEVKVAEEDRGKVIGKQGRIIKAIRTIMMASSSRQAKRVNVELIE